MATILPLILISIFLLRVLSSNTIPNQDVSYMKLVHDATELPENEDYDYIIIGGGTAGCPLAATLSSKFSVLLLERGSDPNKYPSVLNEQDVLSKGSLHLNSSTDVKNNPIVRFNYYSNPNDLAQCVRGLRKVGDLLKTRMMEKIKTRDLEGNKGFLFLGPPLPENLSDISSVEEYCKETVFINVPWWYLAVNRMMTQFLTHRTKSKFVFAGPSKSAETLIRYFDYLFYIDFEASRSNNVHSLFSLV
ncbi:(R)-mandelonitrile lyase 1, partial [Cucurbita argyrosperma subsp. sororia]